MSGNFNTYSDNNFIKADAERCVACGLCLPHCPTYQLAKVETESPRGRISLISALASGELAASEELGDLLQHCLLCRTCEKMCPSSVPFASLMDRGRVLHSQMIETRSISTRAASRLIDFLFRNPEWLRMGAHFSPLLKRWPGLLKKMDNRRQNSSSLVDYLPSVKAHKKWHKEYPSAGTGKKVNLFLGCVARCMDGETLDDALYVLSKIGFTVSIPPRQSCCGALSLHAGRGKETLKIMQKNVRAFENAEQSPIVYTATGCGTSLLEYDQFLQDNGLSSRVHEICAFIDANWPQEMTHLSCNMNILLHTPCSLENSPAGASAPRRLLNRVEGIKLQAVNSPYGCCGAAGTKMLTDYNVSSQLRNPVLDQVEQLAPDIIVTSNFGCALHLAEGLRKTGQDIAIKHPVSLLADILRDTER